MLKEGEEVSRDLANFEMKGGKEKTKRERERSREIESYLVVGIRPTLGLGKLERQLKERGEK